MTNSFFPCYKARPMTQIKHSKHPCLSNFCCMLQESKLFLCLNTTDGRGYKGTSVHAYNCTKVRCVSWLAISPDIRIYYVTVAYLIVGEGGVAGRGLLEIDISSPPHHLDIYSTCSPLPKYASSSAVMGSLRRWRVDISLCSPLPKYASSSAVMGSLRRWRVDISLCGPSAVMGSLRRWRVDISLRTLRRRLCGPSQDDSSLPSWQSSRPSHTYSSNSIQLPLSQKNAQSHLPQDLGHIFRAQSSRQSSVPYKRSHISPPWSSHSSEPHTHTCTSSAMSNAVLVAAM